MYDMETLINWIKTVFNIDPTFKNPMPDNGFMIEYIIGDKYIMLEFYQDGENVLLTREVNGKMIKAWDFTQIDIVKDILTLFINANKS
jgi:hypothetical protein